jgi:Spy/CpxP family protein refolding chaperone
MKRIILSVAVLSMAIAVQAQEIPERKSEKPGMMDRKRHHQGMEMKQLNLTEDQRAKFKTQHENFRQQMEELKKNENITVKEWKSRMETLRNNHKASIGNILTSDQKAQVEKMKAEGKAKHDGMSKERGDKMREGGKTRHDGMSKERNEKMKTHLGLTDEQSSKMEVNRKEMGEKMKAIRENTSMNAEQKQEQMKELHKKQKDNLKSILTDEQLKKLKETKSQRPERDRMKSEPKQSI